jgi:hypothetical protein
MTGLSDYAGRKTADLWTGKTTVTLPTAYVALWTVLPTDAGSGGTEVTGGSYARVATSGATWNAAAGSAPISTSNASAITFPTSTSSWGSVVGWTHHDAASAGNMIFSDYLGGFLWLQFTCTSASPGVITLPGHGYANGDTVVVSAEFGGTLPTTAGSWAGLLTVANVTTDTFTVGVNTTSTGSGMVRKVVAQTIGAGVTPSFAGGTPGALVLTYS